MEYEFDVAISFAEEDRDAALALSLALEMAGLKKIYYYPDNLGETAGKKLHATLRNLFLNESRFSVPLLSKRYFKKGTAVVELEAIQGRVKQDPNIVCVIPVMLQEKLNLSKFPFLKKLTFLKWDHNPKQIAEVIKNYLGKDKTMAKELIESFAKKVNVEQVNTTTGNSRYQKNSLKLNL